MQYFQRLQQLLQVEKEADKQSYQRLNTKLSPAARREAGVTWYPIAIRDTEIGRGDYLTIEMERTTHQDIAHSLRFGMTAALFSNHNPSENRIEGTVTQVSGNRLKLALRVDELPDWTRAGKLGVDTVFDDNSYREMELALKAATAAAEDSKNYLAQVITGQRQLRFAEEYFAPIASLNVSQNEAVQKILAAEELAIVHGPPGTGKTTTLVQAIKALLKKEGERILVTAPSNAAVDLLSERLSAAGLTVVRVGNPAKVNEGQLSLTLDSQLSSHPGFKEIKRLKKQASEYRDMAQKYKRSFGRDEQEQRKALFAEARKLMEEVEKTERYIGDAVLSKAQVITATLVGANHYSVRHLKYGVVVIDEAGQALEPACWVPILKGKKLVMAGDHLQLPPTIKSTEAEREGLGKTLMEKMVEAQPQAVVLLNEQYRMNEAIAGFSSQEFYNNQLMAHPFVAQRLVFAGDKPLLFIDTAGCGYEETVDGTGISNTEEAQFLVRHLVQYIAELKLYYPIENFPSVAVISPYRHQVELLKDAVYNNPELQEIKPALSVNTIDSFQGQERDVVYISLTRSNADSAVGFLSEVRRMNVAMTRARKKLVMIGDGATLSGFPFYADFISYTQERNAYHSAWEFLV